MRNRSSNCLTISIFFVWCLTICSTVSIALPQEFQFDESGKLIAYTNAERHDLTVLSFPERAVLFRATIADFFPENSWEPLNSINPIPAASFNRLSLHPEGKFIAFGADGFGVGSSYSGIFNLSLERSIELHFGVVKNFEFSPDGVWVVASDFGGTILTPFGAMAGSQPVLPTELQSGRESRSFYFSPDCNMVAECTFTYTDVQKLKAATDIQIYRTPGKAEVLKQVRNNAEVELELVKQFRFEGHANDLRFSPDNKWLLWKGWPLDGIGNRPFMARIDVDDSQVQDIQSEDELKFWGDVCFAGTKTDYFILAQKTGEVDSKDRVSLWKQPVDLKKPAQLIFSKPGSCSIPIQINRAGTHAIVGLEISAGGRVGVDSDAEAVPLGGSQFLLIDLTNMKEVWASSMKATFARFHPTKPTVVVREGDTFLEYDFAGQPVAKDELPTTPEAQTKR